MALPNSIEDKLDRGFSEIRRAGQRIGRHARSHAADLQSDVTTDMRALVDELEDLLKHADGTDVEALRTRLRSRLSQARGKLDDASDDTLRRLREQAERMSHVVRENPWQTAGVVVGLAFIAGLLLARR